MREYRAKSQDKLFYPVLVLAVFYVIISGLVALNKSNPTNNFSLLVCGFSLFCVGVWAIARISKLRRFTVLVVNVPALIGLTIFYVLS
jgi:hypothetical protein